MEVTSAPQEKQILKCLGHMQRPFVKRLGYIAGISTFVAICLSTFLSDFLKEQQFFNGAPPQIRATFFPLSLALFYLFTQRFLNSCLPVSYFYPEGVMLRTRTFTIDRRGLHSKSVYDEGTIQWEGILKIEQTADAFLFYLDKSAANIIPLNAFANTDEADAFLATAREYWLAAQKELTPQSTPVTPDEGA
ncbi:MAG TPA: YcxB family protein [Alphaproteobacteria bacterium]|nr:YcxB family protein [Alphaproteobacteria bacterium]